MNLQYAFLTLLLLFSSSHISFSFRLPPCRIDRCPTALFSKNITPPLTSLLDFKDVITSTPLSLIFFTAPWCGPCRLTVPSIAAVSPDPAITCREVNVDEQPEITEFCEVESIPTILVYQNEKEVERLVGSIAEITLLGILNKHTNNKKQR